MSILREIVNFIKDNQEDIVLVIGVVLISLLCFAAGYLTAVHNQKQELEIRYENKQQKENSYYRGRHYGTLFSPEIG